MCLREAFMKNYTGVRKQLWASRLVKSCWCSLSRMVKLCLSLHGTSHKVNN
jgi:hypothetical protein